MKIDSDLILLLTGRLYTQPSAVLPHAAADELNAAEARQGPSAARHTAKSGELRDIDLYQLVMAMDVAQNKIAILRLLRRSDLIKILFLLDKEKLLWGLRLFSKEKLLRLMSLLPKRLLLKMMLSVMSFDGMMQRLPAEELIHMMRSPRITKREMYGGLETLPKKYLQFLLQKITGKRFDRANHQHMVRALSEFRRHHLNESFKKLSYKALTPLTTHLTRKDPELMQRISNSFLFRQFELMTKPMMIESMRVLPEEMLIKFLTMLPTKALTVAASQIDEKQLSLFLMSERSDLLFSLAGVEAA